MKLTLSFDPESDSAQQFEEMREYFGYGENNDAFAEALIEAAYRVMEADKNNECLIVTPEGDAPIPIPFDEFFRPRPKAV